MSGLQIIEIEKNSELLTDDTIEEIRCVDKIIDDNNDKWQKLVLYYLARLKGLCDWRNNSRSKVKESNTKFHLKRCSSQDLERRIIDNVKHKPITRFTKKANNSDANAVSCYMAAGYEEGKQQAVKIISRSLKYGVMTGILLKRGNCYRIAPEYLCDGEKKKAVTHQRKLCETSLMRHKCSVKSVKTNVRRKDNNKKRRSNKKTSNVTVKGKKRKRALNKNHCCAKQSTKTIKVKNERKRYYDDNSDTNLPKYKRNKRSSDTDIQLKESSNSNTTLESVSRSITPLDDRRKKRGVKAKRLRPKIQKPNNYVPPLKKPRTQSQSKSPSHHTDDDEVKDKHGVNAKNKCNKQKLINKFRMPRPRRYSDVMSSMSSSSLSSSCTCIMCTPNDREKNQTVKRIRRK